MGELKVIVKPDIVDVTGPRAVAEGGTVRWAVITIALETNKYQLNQLNCSSSG